MVNVPRKANIVVPVTAAIVIVTILSTAVTYIQTRQQILEMFDAKGNALSDFIQHAATNYLMNYDLTAMAQFIKWAEKDPQVEYASILLEGKTVIDGTLEPSNFPTAIVYEREIRSSDGQMLGVFKVGYKRSVFQQFFVQSLATHILFVLLSMALVSAVLIWTYFKLADRLRHIAGSLSDSSGRLVSAARSVETASVTLKMGHQSQALVLERARTILQDLKERTQQPVLAANANWREVVESLSTAPGLHGQSVDEVCKTVEILDELIQKTLRISTEYSSEASLLAEQADHIRGASTQLVALLKVEP